MFIAITRLVLQDKKSRQDHLKESTGGGNVKLDKKSSGKGKKGCC